MSDDTTPDLPARLERLERTVRRVRRWLLISLVAGLVVLAFAVGRGSAMRQFQPRPGGAGPHPQMGGQQHPPMDEPRRPKR
ncbi:MAG: hypothetical protein ACKO4V_06770 [Planctomycetota bacterium]